MSDTTAQRACPSCGSRELVEGMMGVTRHTFFPPRRSFWSNGLPLVALACRRCGHVAMFVRGDAMAKLREQPAAGG